MSFTNKINDSKESYAIKFRLGGDYVNNKKILYFIVAKSGTGKDYITNKICNEFNKEKVISATTREPRKGEKDTHRFVSNEVADKEFGQALGKTVFNGNRYYTTLDDVKDKDFYIIDQKGIETFNYRKLKKDVNVIYVKSKWYIRAYHMLKRGDSIKSIINRLRNDRRCFDDKYLENISIITLNGSDELYKYFTEKYTK